MSSRAIVAAPTGQPQRSTATGIALPRNNFNIPSGSRTRGCYTTGNKCEPAAVATVTKSNVQQNIATLSAR